jgi:glycosyltransferase involved in cell wall biosynthesis
MISVCMATYNGEAFLKKQVDSILSQLSEEDELVVSDDGSTDSTIEILKLYNDSRIKIYNHESKKNPYYKDSKVARVTYNFENALKNAKGDYIFLSDQDDVWKDNKVKECISVLNNNSLVLTNFSSINENDTLIEERVQKKCPFRKNNYLNILTPPFLGCAMAFRRDLFPKILPIPESVCIHDLWIGLIALKYGTVKYIDEPLFSHRFSSINTSSYGRKSTNPLLMKLKYRFFNFIELCKR